MAEELAREVTAQEAFTGFTLYTSAEGESMMEGLVLEALLEAVLQTNRGLTMRVVDILDNELTEVFHTPFLTLEGPGSFEVVDHRTNFATFDSAVEFVRDRMRRV